MSRDYSDVLVFPTMCSNYLQLQRVLGMVVIQLGSYISLVVLFLFLLWFNIPVNNFSVMLRRSHLFLRITSTFGD